MIGWLAPGALYGLVLAGAPLAIHLLRTRRADRLPFPTIRFVKPSISAAVRVRSPSDWGLLILRAAIIAAAVLALAQPVWLTTARLAGWNAATARVVVVDISESMHRPGRDGRRPQDAAEEAASAERRDATYFHRFDTDRVARDLVRAAAWLHRAPPARREIVIVTDAQRGTIDAADLAVIPRDAGVRFVVVGDAPEAASVDLGARLAAPGAVPRTQQVELTTNDSRLTLGTLPPSRGEGLRLLTAARDEPDAGRLVRAVADAGAPAGNVEQPLTFLFPTAIRPRTIGRITDVWMVRTLIRLQQDDELQAIARHSGRAEWGALDRELDTTTWAVVARDVNNDPVVAAASSNGEMIIAIGSPVGSLLAAKVVRDTLVARQPLDHPEAEVSRISPDVLAARSRAPGPVDGDAWRRVETSDGRWVWIVVLALLGAEQWIRSRRVLRVEEESSRAAA